MCFKKVLKNGLKNLGNVCQSSLKIFYIGTSIWIEKILQFGFKKMLRVERILFEKICQFDLKIF